MTTDPENAPPAIQFDGQEHEQERGRTHDLHIIKESQVSDHQEPQSRSRRGSISSLVERLRSRSRSRSKSRSRQPTIGGIKEDEEVKEYTYSRRKSTDMRGDYADTLRAQVEHMEKLRLDQARDGITHNADGIPIPPPVNPPREGRRRSIIASLSRSASREPSMDRSTLSPDSDKDKEFKYSRRKSSEISGPYAAALQSQLEYMEKLREEQAKEGITTNADGIPIPPPVNPPRQSRRSSIVASLSRSASREPSRTRSRDSSRDRRTLSPDSAKDKEYKYSRRKSAEISGPYAATLQSQLDYMENLREDQANQGITHNADGIPIPAPVNPGTERRKSVTQAFGLNKNLI